MILDTNEFLAALKRLKPFAPRRRTTTRYGAVKRVINDDLYISLLFGEAVFSSHGVQTRCVVEKANWRGYVSTDFGLVLTFLKVKPTGKTVTISTIGDKLRIESLTIACHWAPIPEWIGQMSAEALFHSDKPKRTDEGFFCPKCGKRQSMPVSYEPNMQLELDGPTFSHPPPTRKCKACDYGWIEII